MPFIVIGIMAVSYGLRQYYATEKGRRVIDGGLLKAPVLGQILR
jgi:type II secretory pathway component PulF